MVPRQANVGYLGCASCLILNTYLMYGTVHRLNICIQALNRMLFQFLVPELSQPLYYSSVDLCPFF
ncbi:hypothetical protein M434DRAFT_393435 [Hypoxylon sp. CO27-5]|nr:hypothetical protein M434DRAFT_393435 [Hypoxylon sp. CO27-5]